MHRSESVQRPEVSPPPFRHPFFATARDDQRADFVNEVEAAIMRADALRARLARARVLEACQ